VLAGVIEAERISERLIPRPTTKIARDLWSRALLLSLSDPLNLPLWQDWVAVHAERFASIAGGQIDSAVIRGCVKTRLVDIWLGS
jgi:hypothetical protein